MKPELVSPESLAEEFGGKVDRRKVIDWARRYETLDKELQQVLRHAEQGRRYVDKLVKVWLKNGEEKWLLIHIEVQVWKESDFAKRMYVYNYRIFDRYDKEVVSLAVLADDDPTWRPSHYGYSRWGFRTSTDFPAPLGPRIAVCSPTPIVSVS